MLLIYLVIDDNNCHHLANVVSARFFYCTGIISSLVVGILWVDTLRLWIYPATSQKQNKIKFCVFWGVYRQNEQTKYFSCCG